MDMDIIQRLNRVSNELSENQEIERDIIRQLRIIVSEQDKPILPNVFDIHGTIDTLFLEDFLQYTVGLHVKEIGIPKVAFLLGNISHHITLH